MREALSIYRRVQGGQLKVAETLASLAMLLNDQGDHDAAEPLFYEALATRREFLGEEHPQVATSLNTLAYFLHNQKADYAAAEAMYREALALRRRLFGESHPDVARSLNNLAVVLKDKGDLAAAEPIQREALALRRKLLGDEHPRDHGRMRAGARLQHSD